MKYYEIRRMKMIYVLCISVGLLIGVITGQLSVWHYVTKNKLLKDTKIESK